MLTQFTPTGPIDVPGNDLEINLDWCGENVAPLIAGYDIAIFQAANVAADGLPLGVKFEDLNGTWCCETFVANENFSPLVKLYQELITELTKERDEIISENSAANMDSQNNVRFFPAIITKLAEKAPFYEVSQVRYESDKCCLIQGLF